MMLLVRYKFVNVGPSIGEQILYLDCRFYCSLYVQESSHYT